MSHCIRLAIFMMAIASIPASYGQQHLKKVGAEDPALPEWAQLLYGPEPNAWEVRAAYEAYYASHPFEKTIHTQYYKRWVSAVQRYVDAEGRVVVPSAEERSALEAQLAGLRGGGETWTFAGPEVHYDSDGSLTPISDHSNVYTIDRAKSDPNRLFCGTESGGVYRSTDQGMHWEFVTKDLLIGSVSAVRIHPTNPDIVFFSAANDIYRSTDGGDTWQVVGQPIFVSQNISAWEIAFNPADPDIVYAACNLGFYRSTDGGDTWFPELPNECMTIAIQPNDPSVIYTIQYEPSLGYSRFYKSTDSGDTWTMYETGWYTENSGYEVDIEGGRLAVSEADPNRIYALLVGYGTYAAGVETNGWVGTWVSYDAGLTWTNPHGLIGTPYTADHPNLMNFSGDDGTYTQIHYNTTIVASQLDADMVLIGGLNIWKSGDACATYQGVAGYIGGLPRMHVDQQEFRIYKTSETTEELWVANDGGVNYSTNFLASHESRCRGILAINLWGYDQGWNEDIMVGGRYHNGNMAYLESYPELEFLSLGGGEAATGYVNYSDENKTYFSDLGGRILPDQLSGSPAYFGVDLFPNESYWFNNSSRILFDNAYFNVAWLGRENKLYRSTNGGSSFGFYHEFGTNPEHPVLWMEQSYTDPDVLYVHQRTGNSSTLWKTADGGASWEAIDLPLSLSNLFFAVSATNSDELWVGYTYGGNGNKVWHTTTGGADWENMTTAALDGEEVWGLAHVYGTDGGVYLALKNGRVVYRNNNLGDWQEYSSGLPVSTEPLRIVPFYKEGVIRLATWNLGVWEAPLYEPAGFLANFSAEYGTFFCPGEPVHFVDHSVVPDGATYSWSFPGATPATSDEKYPTVVYNAAGVFDVTLTVTYGGESISVTKQAYIASEEAITLWSPTTEGFEGGSIPESWRFAHPTGGGINWAVTDDAGGFGESTWSMRFDNFWQDAQGNRDEVWLPKTVLPGFENTYALKFDVAYAEYGGQYSDTLAVLASVDCGETWTELYVLGGDALATSPDYQDYFIPTAAQWRAEEIELGPEWWDSELIIAFQNRGHWGNVVYVDNVNIDFIGAVDSEPALQVRLFPNPADDRFTLHGVDEGALTISDATGRMVWRQRITADRTAVDVSTWPAGVYLVQVQAEGAVVVQQMVVR